jgi:uncharacterized phage protein gp47/JayE
MPYARPTLTQLRTQARSDAASLTSSGVLLRFSNLGILADVLAGLTNGNYGYLDRIALNATPFTAVDLEIIAGWAALKNVFQKQPQAAALQVNFAGTPNAGYKIPAGTSVVRLIDGFTFTTAADAPINGAGVATPVVVATETGAAGNTTVGSAMVLGASVTGIQSQGSAGSATAAGADLETATDFRARMLQAYAQPPQGGSVADYTSWAEDVAGVTRAWVAPQGMGPGTVSVYFMMDSAEAAHGGFPQGTNGVAAAETRDVAATGDQLAVANYVFTQCNVNALVYGCAPTQNTITISITGLSEAGSAVQAAIQGAVASVFLANGSPGGVLLPDRTTGGVIELSAIEAAIGSISGSAGYVIEAMTASAGAASPTSNIASNFGALPTLADIVWL